MVNAYLASSLARQTSTLTQRIARGRRADARLEAMFAQDGTEGTAGAAGAHRPQRAP